MKTPTTDTIDTTCFATVAGRGPHHSFLLPGLVPDAQEAFLRQRHLFRAFGAVTTVTWPYDAFDLGRLIDGIAERIRAAAARGERPILLGMSVGGGVALELLRRTREQPLPLAGIMLVSPLTCADDLAPLLRRYVDPILHPSPGTSQEVAIERGRTFFRTIAARALGEPAHASWRSLLTPTGWSRLGERRIRDRIEATLVGIPTAGAIDRVLAIAQFAGVHHDRQPLHHAPTSICWGSRERHTLRMEGPGTGLLCRPDLAQRVFPEVEVQWVYDADGGEVPHASLLRHAHCFNPHFKRFLKRLSRGAARPLAAAG